jgi:hypothetical protein
MIKIGKPRNCIFTNSPADCPIIIGHFKDKHNPAKKVPSCKEYVEFRKNNMNPDLYDLETKIFIEYWKIEALLSLHSATKVKTDKLEKLQGLILEMMSKQNKNKELDFESQLQLRIETLLDRKPELEKIDNFSVLKNE